MKTVDLVFLLIFAFLCGTLHGLWWGITAWKKWQPDKAPSPAPLVLMFGFSALGGLAILYRVFTKGG